MIAPYSLYAKHNILGVYAHPCFLLGVCMYIGTFYFVYDQSFSFFDDSAGYWFEKQRKEIRGRIRGRESPATEKVLYSYVGEV